MNNPPGPFARLSSLPKAGDIDVAKTYAAVGHALSSWEMHVEMQIAYLYNVVVRPDHISFAIKRSFGTLNAPTAKRPMIAAAAVVFFARFPEPEASGKGLERDLEKVLADYATGAARRNAFAHGIVAPHVADHAAITGFYVGPNFVSPGKRDINLTPEYLYSSEEIAAYAGAFYVFETRIRTLCTHLLEHFQSFPEERRKRY